jgi:hypothetical protein
VIGHKETYTLQTVSGFKAENECKRKERGFKNENLLYLLRNQRQRERERHREEKETPAVLYKRVRTTISHERVPNSDCPAHLQTTKQKNMQQGLKSLQRLYITRTTIQYSNCQ